MKVDKPEHDACDDDDDRERTLLTTRARIHAHRPNARAGDESVVAVYFFLFLPPCFCLLPSPSSSPPVGPARSVHVGRKYCDPHQYRRLTPRQIFGSAVSMGHTSNDVSSPKRSNSAEASLQYTV